MAFKIRKQKANRVDAGYLAPPIYFFVFSPFKVGLLLQLLVVTEPA
jgi:hypothetical protein